MAYIYEHIRTRGFEAMHFEEHYVRLDALARRVFLSPFKPSREELQKMIAEKLRDEGFSPRTENAVCVRYYSDGELCIEPIELIYNHFSLRAISPQGYIYRTSGDLILENTSAKESLVELNRTMAQISDEGVAIWVDEQGEVLAIDGSSVVAIFEDGICFSRRGNGVEFERAFSAIERSRANVSRGAIMADELHRAKELLFIDFRGVTALHHFDSNRYMDIIAERVADTVAKEELR